MGFDYLARHGECLVELLGVTASGLGHRVSAASAAAYLAGRGADHLDRGQPCSVAARLKLATR